MAPLTVDPEALDAAGNAVISVGEKLGSTVSTLTTTLAGYHGMSGDDPAGAAFGHSYDDSASKLLEAMTATRNGLCRLGDGVRMSARNYSIAEANSNISGHSNPLPGTHPTGSITAGSTPSSVGRGTGTPAGWDWVSKYIGMIWPTADSAELRAAAAAWISAGTNFELTEIHRAEGPMRNIAAQQIPEGPAIAAAFDATHRCAAGILQHCTTIATRLTSYATKIDTVHAAIIDLLSRICNPLTGIKEVWEFLTDEDEDEIKKIANDIRTIINQFTAEIDALRHQIATALAESKTILDIMARYADKEWDEFLHHTDIGRALDQVGQYGKGLGESVSGLVEDAWTYGPVRAQVDPQGSYQSWQELLHGMAPLVGLGDDHAPGVAQSWKDLGKNAVHWDEWKTNPAEAAGQSTFDLATLLIPGGGEAAAAAKGAHATADAAEAASAASRAESAATRALEDAPKPHAPASGPQLSHPEPHPTSPTINRPPPPADESSGPTPTKPTSAPTDASAPHSPTESTPPAVASASQSSPPANFHAGNAPTTPGGSSALGQPQSLELAATHSPEALRGAVGLNAGEGSGLHAPPADPALSSTNSIFPPDRGEPAPAEPSLTHTSGEPSPAPSEPAPAEHSPEPTDRTPPHEPAHAPPHQPDDAIDPAAATEPSEQITPREPMPFAERPITHDPPPSHLGPDGTTPISPSSPSEAASTAYNGDAVRPSGAGISGAAASHESVAAPRAGLHEPIGRGGQPGEGGSPNLSPTTGARHAEDRSPNSTSGGPHNSEDRHEHPGDGEPSNPDRSDDPPPALHRGESLPSKEMGSEYVGEDDPKNSSRWTEQIAPGKVVEYFSPERLEQTRLFARDGLLHNVWNGMPFDTSGASTHWSGGGRAMFVMDRHGNFYASINHEVGRLHHSSFLGGKPVAGAGELEVRDGLVTAVTRKSGHYAPTPEMLTQVRDMLLEQGVDISAATFEDGF